jgi:hypothetical protein
MHMRKAGKVESSPASQTSDWRSLKQADSLQLRSAASPKKHGIVQYIKVRTETKLDICLVVDGRLENQRQTPETVLRLLIPETYPSRKQMNSDQGRVITSLTDISRRTVRLFPPHCVYNLLRPLRRLSSSWWRLAPCHSSHTDTTHATLRQATEQACVVQHQPRWHGEHFRKTGRMQVESHVMLHDRTCMDGAVDGSSELSTIDNTSRM